MSSHKQNFSWDLQKEWTLTIRRRYSRDFPGSPVVSTQRFQWCGPETQRFQWCGPQVLNHPGEELRPANYMVLPRKKSPGFLDFLLVQWLRRCAGCWGLIPGRDPDPTCDNSEFALCN